MNNPKVNRNAQGDFSTYINITKTRRTTLGLAEMRNTAYDESRCQREKKELVVFIINNIISGELRHNLNSSTVSHM